MRRLFNILLVLSCLTAGAVWAIEKISPDPKGEAVVNEFMQALEIPDEAARLAAVVKLVPPSMLTKDGHDLLPTYKQFSYKKACQGVKFYSVPVQIKEVHKGNVQTVGTGDEAVRGRIDKYFVMKKPGVNGMPAPIHVLFPENGGDPKIVNFGSL